MTKLEYMIKHPCTDTACAEEDEPHIHDLVEPFEQYCDDPPGLFYGVEGNLMYISDLFELRDFLNDVLSQQKD